VQSWGSVSEGEVAEAVRLARDALQAAKDDPDTLWMAALLLSAFAGEHALAMSAVDRALAIPTPLTPGPPKGILPSTKTSQSSPLLLLIGRSV
jgi:hypothetical protein